MRRLAIATLATVLAAPFLFAQAAPQSTATQLPANYIHVSAPMAQQLVVSTKAAHPEIKKLGLHATPVSSTDNAIIGSDTPAKVGKRSSPKDMEKLATGKPSADRIEKEGIYDLLLPITDREGRSIGDGFVVMEVPFDHAASEAEALRIGVAIRDQMQQQIGSRAALYQ